MFRCHQKLLLLKLTNVYIIGCFIECMKFNNITLTVSLSKFAKSVFSELDKIKPNNISFSMALAIAVKHYIDTHNEPVDIYGETPNYYSHIETWKSEIKNMSAEEFIKLQQRHTQLGNIIKTQVMKKI